MKLALEELQNARDHIYLLPENEQPLTEEQILNRINAAITVLHQEVYGDANDKSQKCAGKQEPVAWMHTTGTGHVYFRKKPQDKVFNPQPVFTSPQPSKPWVGLTADEIWKCNKAKSGSAVEFHICYEHQNLEDFAESIEAKLKEKNA
jgi:hypothetical protein